MSGQSELRTDYVQTTIGGQIKGDQTPSEGGLREFRLEFI